MSVSPFGRFPSVLEMPGGPLGPAATPSYNFVPIAFETMGPINSSGVALIKELGRRMTLITGDTCIQETSYLFQRLSVAIQGFNAVALRVSFLQSDIVEG